jgi:hypothetical protein
MTPSSVVFGIEIHGSVPDPCREILTPGAGAFVAERERKLGPRRRELLDRRAEIAGPGDRKRAIRAFEPGAHCWMAGSEAAHSPT